MLHARPYLSPPARVLDYLGQALLNSHVGQLTTLFLRALWSLASGHGRWRVDARQIIMQAFFTGIEALPSVFLVATLFGVVVIVEALTVVPKVGFGNFFGNLMVIVIIRELGPILTAFLIAGRSGSALATYIGSMQVESEVDALETMGIDPVRYLAMPALVGGMIASFLANGVFAVSAVGAGFLVAKGLVNVAGSFFQVQLDWNVFSQSILEALRPMDFVMAVVKPLVFAAIITTNAYYHAAQVQNDVREVPKATSRSVVHSFMLIVVSDLILSLAYILEYLRQVNSVI